MKSNGFIKNNAEAGDRKLNGSMSIIYIQAAIMENTGYKLGYHEIIEMLLDLGYINKSQIKALMVPDLNSFGSSSFTAPEVKYQEYAIPVDRLITIKENN